MTARVWIHEVAGVLTAAAHTGLIVRQDSPRTARVCRAGPDQVPHLTAYADTLRAAGYSVELQAATGIRPDRIKVTHDSGRIPDSIPIADVCIDPGGRCRPAHDYPPADEGNTCRHCGAEADPEEQP